MGRYVVTGGAGAIGSRLVRYLLARGVRGELARLRARRSWIAWDQAEIAKELAPWPTPSRVARTTPVGRKWFSDTEAVHVIDDLSSGHKWLLPKDERIRFEQLDVGRNDLDFDPHVGVFHLAAHFANENSVDHPEADLLTNGLGTLRVLRAAAAAEASCVAFASAGCAANHEDTPYQIHKTLGEAYCRYFNREIRTNIYRFHNSYGPGEVPGKYRNVIPNFIWRAMHGRDLILFRNGEDARDFVYVDDLVEILAERRGALIEIGTGQLTTVRRLAEIVLAATKSKSRIVLTPESRRWDHTGRAAIASPVPAKGWIPLEEGIARTVAWFKENYEAIKASVR